MFPYFIIFGRYIYTYSLLAAIGAIAAGVFCCAAAKRRFKQDDSMLMLLLCGAAGALIGGHILYGITNIRYIAALIKTPGLIKSFSYFIAYVKIIFGGAVFYGGLLGGIAAGSIYIKVKKLDYKAYADIAAAGIPLFHTFGRIGCFLGGCCYGRESEWGIYYKNALLPELVSTKRFPIQLVEAAFNLLLFFLLFYLLKSGRLKGRLMPVYLLVYPAGRFIIEFFRDDDYRGFLFGLSTSQLISIVLFATAAVIMIVFKVRSAGRKACKN